MFDKFLTVTTLMCRPVSWSESSCLVRERRVQYRCYSQLNHYIRDPATQPYSAPISCTSNTESRSEEKEKEGEAEVVSAVAGNGAAPAATPMQGPIPDSTEISISFEGHNSSIFSVR